VLLLTEYKECLEDLRAMEAPNHGPQIPKSKLSAVCSWDSVENHVCALPSTCHILGPTINQAITSVEQEFLQKI